MYRMYERAEFWPKNPTACEGKYAACPMLPLCWAAQYDDPQKVVEDKLVKVDLAYA